MNPFQVVFTKVVALTVLSAGCAMAIVVAIDTRARPGARIVAVRLMEIALLGAGVIAALLSNQPGYRALLMLP